jgi:hypothetical protein
MKTLEDVILKSSVKELEVALVTITYNLSFQFQNSKFSEFVKVLNPIGKRIISHRNTLVVDKLRIYEDTPFGLIHSIAGLNVNKDDMIQFKSTTLGKVIYGIIEGV